MEIRAGVGEKVFNVCNVMMMLMMITVTLYPMIYVLFASLSDSSLLMAEGDLLLRPLGFTIEAYEMAFKNPMIFRGFLNTLLIVSVGTTVNILLTSMGAYFLAARNVMLKKAVMFFIVVTMFFNGGIIPFYFTVRDLQIDNTYWSLILPVAINTFNLIIMRTAFMSLPESILESAKIDGAGHLTILFRIVLPLSLPTVAVIVLYYAVFHWNAWFNAMLFISERTLLPLQLILREILILNDTSQMSVGNTALDQVSIGESIKYAVIIIATLPVLCIYPFLQKYFVKGVMIGSVKE